MNRNSLYIVVAVLAVVTAAVIIVGKKIPQQELELLMTKGVVPATLIQGPKKASHKVVDPEAPLADSEKVAPLEHTDEELQQWITNLNVLTEIPWETFDIATMFANRSARSCNMLSPDTSIVPLVTVADSLDGKLVTQRMTAFHVGLIMDARARGSLPNLSKATIENYLAQHLLAIQPEICRTRDGEFMFTGNVNAAFFSKSMPSITGSPEPMIQDAVKSFRVLGVLPPVAASEQETPLPRTLVMAFSYKRDKVVSGTLSLGPQDEYELLFLHLLPQTESSALPKLAVFTTTDGRSTFQELDLNGQSVRRNNAAIMASIRFEDFKMMGLYPANPIVTGLQNKIRGSIPTEELKSRIASQDVPVATALGNLLDELHNGPEFSRVTTNP